MKEYRLVFGTSESCDVFLRKSDDEEELHENVVWYFEKKGRRVRF